jgi:hypothetical protein
MRLLLATSLWILGIGAAPALELDNEAGVYRLTALPDAVAESRRTNRMQWSDQVPAGRHVRRGEVLTIHTEGLPAGHTLAATIGFLEISNREEGQQVEPLGEGAVEIRAEQGGPLFFKFTTPRGQLDSGGEVEVRVEGGNPLPLYVDDGSMDASEWQDELAEHGRAPFVQLLSDRAVITLPTRAHASNPIDDPAETFATINEVIDRQNELAGFDGGTPRDIPSPLRLHYLVDFGVSLADRESFYMYATDQFVGMLDDNFGELTDPRLLRREWGIWHETGHMHQQRSWTFDAVVEVSVNLFSLYTQEHFGQPSALTRSEDGEPSYMDRARDYLAEGAPDFRAEPPEDDDGSSLFIRLVMFHQLQQAYGWELFQDLHKHFRANPLPGDASDDDKADAFIEAICQLTGVDYRSFFETWGLTASEAANDRIDAEGYAEPDEDLSQRFD